MNQNAFQNKFNGSQNADRQNAYRKNAYRPITSGQITPIKFGFGSLMGLILIAFVALTLLPQQALSQTKKKSTSTSASQTQPAAESKTADQTSKPISTESAPSSPAPVSGEQNDLSKMDEEITNARMRAELGAAKQWSFNAALSYNGSTLARPTDKLRPNIVGGTTNADLSTSLSGTLSVNFRKDKNNSLSLSTGVNVLTPFNGDWTRSRIQNPTYSGKPGQKQMVQRINVADPSATYSHSRRIGDIQSITAISVLVVTDPVFQSQTGMLGNFGISQTLAVQQGNWTLGGYISGFSYVYESSLNSDQKDGEATFSGSVVPFVEYQFNDLIGWRAVFNYFGWDYLKNATKKGQSAYSFYTPQNSTGVMFSLSRDIWLYPNIQFLPFNLRSDLTNWGVQAIINL